MARQIKENLIDRARLIDWFSPVGGNWIFWLRNEKLIGDLIQANGLNPVTISNAPAMTDMIKMPAAMPERSTLMDIGIRGGIRAPHLHFQDAIYMLDNRQWARFSKEIVNNFKTALNQSKAISFEQAVVLGSMAQTFEKG